MSASANPPERDPRQRTGPPSPTVRTTVTLLLIVHLFAVGIGVLSAARPLSALRNKLADVPLVRPYLQLLHMDVAYNFHLTDGTEIDVDHFAVVAPQEASADGPDADGAVRLPQRGLAPGIRRERLQQLAFFAAPGQLGDPEVKTLLPKSVAVGLLRSAAAPHGTYRLRIRRQMPVAREHAHSPQRSLSDPYADERFETAFEAAILWGESEVHLLEIAPEEQRAGLRDDENPGEGE
jgi:hypothetical protein